MRLTSLLGIGIMACVAYATPAAPFGAANRRSPRQNSAVADPPGTSDSARILMEIATLQERLGLWYEARRTLAHGASASEDLVLLRRHAATEDQFGVCAGEAYQQLVEACEKEASLPADYPALLKRGLQVSLRDGDSAHAEWFGARLALHGFGAYAAQFQRSRSETADEATVPGGYGALLRLGGIHGTKSSEDFLLAFSRCIVQVGWDPVTASAFRDRVSDYFNRLGALESFGVREGRRVVVHLSMENSKSRLRTEKVLDLLGWHAEVSEERTAIRLSDGSSAARKQLTSTALGIDVVGMQDALQSGRPFDLEIVDEKVPILFGESAWMEAADSRGALPGGVAEALASNPGLARLYVSLSALESDTALQIRRAVGLKTLAENYSVTLFHFSSAILIRDGRVVVPGGEKAEATWQSLAGASPAFPAAFIGALFRKDAGKLLAFYAGLMQLDSARQRFFTASHARTAGFYVQFRDSFLQPAGMSLRRRTIFLLDLLAQVPINAEGQVVFPGSVAIWIETRARSGQMERVAPISLAPLSEESPRVATPGVEDAVLLRLAKNESRHGQNGGSGLAAFLAVAHIDAHRKQALDPASAQLLAEGYAELTPVLPYLASIPAFTGGDLRKLLQLEQRFRDLRPLLRNDVVGEWEALAKFIAVLSEAGRLTDDQAEFELRRLCERFLEAAAPEAFADASLRTLREILGNAFPDNAGPDEAIRDLLLGPPQPVTVRIGAMRYDVDGVEDRRHGYREVLDLQKVPSLQVLFTLCDAAQRIADDPAGAVQQVAVLDKYIGELPTVALPPDISINSTIRDLLSDLDASGPRRTVRKMQAVLADQADPEKLPVLARKLLGLLNPQVRLALTGVVYALYLSPEDALVREDPLFLRKHRFASLDSSEGKSGRFLDPDLVSGQSFGSFVVGGFADFGPTAGRVSMATLRRVGESAEFPGAAILGSLRDTRWQLLRDVELRWIGLSVLAAREWILDAAVDGTARAGLASAAQGLLSPARLARLLRALEHRDWNEAWRQVTLSDLYFLGDGFTRSIRDGTPLSPTLQALRSLQDIVDPSRLRWFGQDLRPLLGCSHPHLVRMPPYEYYEGSMLPDRLAARSGEYKLQLAASFDRAGLPAALLGAVAEPLAVKLLADVHPSYPGDWHSLQSAFLGINEQLVGKVMRGR